MSELKLEGVGAHAPAPYIFSRGDAAEKALRMVVDWWRKKYPTEVREYRAEVQFLKDTLRDGTGLTPLGDGAAFGILPVRVSLVLEQLAPGFWNNGGRELWHRVYPDFEIRTKQLGQLTGGK